MKKQCWACKGTGGVVEQQDYGVYVSAECPICDTKGYTTAWYRFRCWLKHYSYLYRTRLGRYYKDKKYNFRQWWYS